MNTGDTNNPEAVAAAFAPDSDAAWAWAFPDVGARITWRAQGFDAVTASAWANEGHLDAITARAWAQQGVTPAAARSWTDLGVPPELTGPIIDAVTLSDDPMAVIRTIARRIHRGDQDLLEGVTMPTDPDTAHLTPDIGAAPASAPALLDPAPHAPPVIVPADPAVRDAWRTEMTRWATASDKTDP